MKLLKHLYLIYNSLNCLLSSPFIGPMTTAEIEASVIISNAHDTNHYKSEYM